MFQIDITLKFKDDTTDSFIFQYPTKKLAEQVFDPMYKSNKLSLNAGTLAGFSMSMKEVFEMICITEGDLL